MPNLVIEAPGAVVLPVAGSDAGFPVRRVYCIGRNYAAHAVEMGHDPDRESPFFFQKNPDNLDPSGEFANHWYWGKERPGPIFAHKLIRPFRTWMSARMLRSNAPALLVFSV